ncbi:hypothetical protein D2A34_12115 [Clostridium chromiireducens]|uniref:YncE family protein n=1 Tax=Clostridium chromiireducens TaxID=225345 RepID=A0A399ILE6_9CLOT|nr:hypothetical protein [Clostridium chromiireducens]RII33928.1 hypothetical protein D2A34_12115 [Clostridium chromiireducens]
MIDKLEKMIYYVSNIGTGRVSIIDGDTYRIIEEVEIGPRPQNIVIDEKNNIYIASDRNNKVTLIRDLFNSDKTWNIPNNGNIKVDSINKKIYACDTEEVCIYNLETSEKIGSLKGFIAANCLELDKDKRRLFVLDILQNEIKVYDTSDFHLINLYKEVGILPNSIIIEKNEQCIYIANKGANKGIYKGNISILNLKNGYISYINLQIGSIITALEQNENFLYAANSGLHRIEVIDLLKRECITNIKTTLPKIQRLRLSPDKKILLVTSRSDDGRGVIDRIDTSNNTIIDTFTFEENNILPYDIGIVTQSKLQAQEEFTNFIDSEEKFKQENSITIIAKKVLSTYQEKIIFSEISIRLPLNMDAIVNLEYIKFKKCEIINETKNRTIVDTRKEYSILQYDFYIPYVIEFKGTDEEKYIVEGKIEGMQKARLYIPVYAEQQGVEFVVNSFATITSNPVVTNEKMKFDVSVLISTKAIVDEMISIPMYNNYNLWNIRGE